VAWGPALKDAALGRRPLLRHLALLFARSIRGKQARRRPQQRLQLEQQQEAGNKSLHAGSTLIL
jgi:hypothetical protein